MVTNRNEARRSSNVSVRCETPSIADEVTGVAIPTSNGVIDTSNGNYLLYEGREDGDKEMG